jgi:hypothetical protein
LGDREWTWIAVAAVHAWIKARSEQAVSSGGGATAETLIHTTGAAPEPWDVGAIDTILGNLADMPGIDWSQPVTAWPRETMVKFLAAAFTLIRKAMNGRDRAASLSTPRAEREASAAQGGPLATADEFNDGIPF